MSEAAVRPSQVQQEACSMRDSLPYACLHCGRRFQYMGTLSVHVGKVHMGEILSKSKQGELKNGQDVASGVEDFDRSWQEPNPSHWMPKTPCGDVGGDDFLCSEYGISFSSTQEAECAQPEPALWESSLSVSGRADPPHRVAFTRPWEDGPTDYQGVAVLSGLEAGRHHEDTQTQGGKWHPPAATFATKTEVAATSVTPLVETDSLTSLSREIEYVFVDEETSFLNNGETPDDHDTAQDPLSIKEEHVAASEVITIKDEEEQDNGDVAERRCHEAPSEVITIDDDDDDDDDDEEEEEQDNGDVTEGHCDEAPSEVITIDDDDDEEEQHNGDVAEGHCVFEDSLAVSGLSGCVKEERGVYLGVEAADSKVTATTGHTSHITRTTAPTSAGLSLSDVGSNGRPPHPDSSGCSGGPLAMGTTPLPRGAGAPTASSGGGSESCGSLADPDNRGTAGGTSAERLSADTVWELIVMAISQSPHRRATMAEMEAYITSRFPQLEKGLHESLGDILCHDKCFVAVPREGGERTSHCWMLDPEYEAAVETGKFGACGARRPFYRGWAAALAALRVRAQHGSLKSRSQPPGAEPWEGLCAALAATASAAGVDAAPRPICLRYASTASPTSMSPSVSDVRSTCLAAPTFSEPGDGRYGDDLPTSDVTAPVDAATSPISESGDTSDSFSDTDCEEAATDSSASGEGEERYRGDAGWAGSANSKPLLTYSQLIAMAILDSPHRRATFSEICTYVASHFPYYEHSRGWRKSLGMTLSRDKAFVNMPLKGSNDNGHYWRLVPKYEEIFDNGNIRRHRLAKRVSSGPLGAVAASEVPTSSGTPRHPPVTHLRLGQQRRDPGPSVRPQPSSTTGGSLTDAAGDGAAWDVGVRGGGGGASVTSSEHSSTTTPTSTRLSVSEVGSTGRAARNSSRPHDGHCEDDTPAPDVPTSTSGAATANSASGDTAGGATDTDSEGSTAGIAADSAGEEQSRGAAGCTSSRPPLSYKELVAMAIAHSPNRRARHSDICAYVVKRFPYFKNKKEDWKHTIRCKLSSSKCFVKAPWEGGNRKVGCWTIDPQYEEMYKNGNLSRTRHPKRPFRRAPAVPRGGGASGHHQRQNRASPAVRTVSTASELSVSGGGVTGGTTDPQADRCGDSTSTTTTTGLTISDFRSAAPVADEPSHPGSGCDDDDTPVSDTDDATAPASRYAVAADTVGNGRTAADSKGTGTGSAVRKRPPFCYGELIAMAIAHSPHRRATASEICTYVASRFPYYRRCRTDWRKTLRNQLSASKCFTREPPEHGHSESRWSLNPKYEHLFEGGNYRQLTYRCHHRHDGMVKRRPGPWCRRSGGVAASLPSSLHCGENEPSTTTTTTTGQTTSKVGSVGPITDEPSHPDSSCQEDDTPVSDTVTADDATAPTSGSGVAAGTAAEGRTATDSGGTAPGSSPDGACSERQSAGRPPFCYAELTAMAISHSPQRRATVLEMFAYIKNHFPYYRRCRKDWRKTLRNKMYGNRCFIKEPHEDGRRASHWRLNPKYEHLFEGGNYRRLTYLYRHQHQQHDGLLKWRNGRLNRRVGGGTASLPSYLHCAEEEASTTTSLTISEVCSADLVADDRSHPGKGCEDDDTPLSDDATAPASGTSVAADTGGDGRTATDSGGTAAGSSHDEARSERQSASAAHTRPPFCHAELIAMAIAHSPQRRATALEMFAYIKSRFPYYSRCRTDWQQMLRQRLSVNKCFTKEPRESGQHTSHWRLNPKYEHLFDGGNYRRLSSLYRHRQRWRGHACLPERARPSGLRASVGLGTASLPSYLHCAENKPSTTTSQTISEVCSAAPVADERSLPGSGCEDDDTPLSDDVTALATGSSVAADTGGDGRTATNSGGTATGSSPGGARSERQSASAARRKPPFCYAELIAMAIAQSPQRRATAPEMFAYVRSRFPYYRCNRKDWEKVLLSQLYNSLCFTRESQEGDRRECHWRLNPKYEHLFEGGNYRSLMRLNPTRRRRHARKSGWGTRPTHLRACRGGGAASLPSYLHCTENEPRSSEISDGNDSASLDSNLQNVTCDEAVVRQEESTHVTSCSVPTQENDAFADDKFSICDVRSIKMEVFEDAIAASGFSKCIKQDPDLDLGMDATDNTVRAITGHTSDITSTRTVTSTSLVPDVGDTGRAAPDSSHAGSTHHETDSTASDVLPLRGEAETLAYTSRGTVNSAADADSESDTTSSAAEEQCLGDGASTSTANTMTHSMFRTLIAKAITQSPHRRATVSEIYAYIASRFPYFRQKEKCYVHNKISSAMYFGRRFIKVPWEGSTKKGNYWTIARAAATPFSVPGVTGNCCNDVASSDRAATTAGGAATGVDEERASGDTGSASTAITKPPFSYEELIAMAIMESPHRRATISEIVGYIARRFPYFERSSKSWQKSVHCKLYFTKFFVKVRHMGGSSQHRWFNYWMLAPKYQRAFENGKFIRHQSLERPFRSALRFTGTDAAYHREHRQQHRADVSAEPRLLESNNRHSTDEAAPDSSHPGDCRRRSDILVPDTVTLTDHAVVPTSTAGVTGNCCAGGNDNDTGGAAVGSVAKSLGEDRLPGNTGSAGITKRKPPFSYEELIAMAIVELPHRRATVTQIITYIARRFPYFERSSKDWQKSIYCKLCFSKAFIKVPLQGGSLKGRFFNYWMLNPKYKLKIRNGSLGHSRPVKQPSRRPLRAATAPEVSHGTDNSPLDLPELRPASADRNWAISGRGGVLSPGCGSSTATLISTRLSVSNVGSTHKAAPDSSHPGGTHCEDDSPPSDATTANSAYRVDGDTDIEGSTADGAADSVGEEQSRVGSGSASNASTRPPLSYKELIAMAIAHSPHRRATHPEICAYIKRRFPYFKNRMKASHHSISCALSYNKCFVKAPFEGSNRKVCYWTIDPQYKETYKNVTLGRARHPKRPLGRAPAVSRGGGTSGHPHSVRHHHHNHQRQQLAGPSDRSASTASKPSVSGGGVAAGATDPQAARCKDSTGKAVPDSSHPDCTHCEDDSPASDATTANSVHCINGVTDTAIEGSTAGDAADSAGEKQSRVGSGSAGYTSSRPPLSYKELIAMAIVHSPHRRATLSEIFTYIMRRFPYFKNKKKARHRAISTTLSTGKCFIKVPWEGSNRKGNYWTIDPQYDDMYKNGNLCRQWHMKRPFQRALRVATAPLVSSAHNLPDANQQKQQPQLMGDSEQSSPVEGGYSSDDRDNPPARDSPSVRMDDSGWCTIEREVSRVNASSVLQLSVSCTSTRQRDLQEDRLGNCGRSPFSCSVCHREFPSKYILKLHFRLHTGERPYSCSICAKAFRLHCQLKAHFLLHTSECPHICGFCHKKFIGSYQLKRHLLVHTGERPHNCGLCHKTFQRKERLKQHLLLHTGNHSYRLPTRGDT